jgi:hypothetical protein
LTDYAAIWDHDAQPKDYIDLCNLCGEDVSLGIEQSDRYGYRVHMYWCACGLTQINPRMTREAYARFYETAYRPLVSAFHGREINAQTIRPEQKEYGDRLARLLSAWTGARERSLLDVGGSTGTVAHTLSGWLHISSVVVLDPSSEELAECRVPKVWGTIEDFQPNGRTWDLITLCQTADHLLDLMGSLKKIKGLLSPDGLFWSDIVDFDVTREVKIDHPFNLTESTYRQFLSKAGFKLLQVNYAPDGVHIGFLAR